MATVYRGYDERLEVERAIKVLSPLLAARAEIRARFETEARTMAKLQHPNIVSVQDVGTDGERVYLVMELVETGSLIDLLDRKGPMSPKDACDAVIAILLGLQAAHARGVVHRDIKPHNVLVTPDGNYKVADFGIAHVTGADRHATRTGMAMGTLSYMAPEQRTNAKQVDGRADLYAVSATFYALLTNKEPFELHAVDHQDEIFEGLPRVLVDIMKRASRFRAEDRFPDAAAMIAAVRDARVMLAPSEPRPLGASGGHPTLALGADSYLGAVVPEGPPAARAVEENASPTRALRGGETFAADLEIDEPTAAAVVPSFSPPPARSARQPRNEPSLISDPFAGKRKGAGREFVAVGLIGLAGVALIALIAVVTFAWWQTSQPEPAPDPVIVDAAPPPAETPAVVEPSAPVEAAPAVGAAIPTEKPTTTKPTPVSTPTPAPVVSTPAALSAPAVAPVAVSTPAAVTQRLSVNSLPWSNVTVDGKGVGTTGWTGTVPVGAHRVGLKTEDGQTKSIELTVKETEPTRFCWDFHLGTECSR